MNSKPAKAAAVALCLATLGASLAPLNGALAATAPAGPLPGACKVRLLPVHDTRADPTTMGSIGGKPVQSPDGPSWVMLALQTLGQDNHINLVAGDATDADIDVNVDLLKAYVISLTMSKSANVVVRAHYSHGANPPEDVVYRGVETGTNWASTQSESRGALGAALSQIVTQVHADVLQRCGAAKAAPAA